MGSRPLGTGARTVGTPARPLGTEPAPEPGAGRTLALWLLALVLFVRAVILVAPVAASFVLVTALASAAVESERVRALIGALACLVPLLLYLQLAALLRRRTRLSPPSPVWFLAVANAFLAGALAFGFADDAGRALRRHGDWFVGERNGVFARLYRTELTRVATYLERFDPPAELAPVIIPPDPANIPVGPWLPGQEPPEARPTVLGWFHPLAGPRRAMPITESRRFGAARPQPRPVECELGHCGVDLGTTLGEPIFAVFDGVVERIESDEERGGRAGRYIRIGHKGGTVVSRYIHLDSIRADLREGTRVRGGELIGRLGRSGVHNSGPHLHFGLSLRENHRERYIDPEPLLRTWGLPTLETVALAKTGASPLPSLPPADRPAESETTESPSE